jgi:hypothetical protein
VPSRFTGSSTPGVTYIPIDGPVEHFDGTLPLGAKLVTDESGYARLYSGATESTLSVGPNSTTYAVPAWHANGELETCKNALTCLTSAGQKLSAAVDTALTQVEGGDTTEVLQTLGNGVYDAASDVGTGLTKALLVEKVDFTRLIPTAVTSPRGGVMQRSDASAKTAAAGPNVEVQMTAAGATFWVVNGSWLVINLASQTFVTLSAGHDLFVPASEAKAAHLDMSASVKTFSLSSLHKWWS